MKHPAQNKNIKGKIYWHLKVLGGAILIALFFNLVLQQKLLTEQLPLMLVLTFIQLEIFIWLGFLFFEPVKTDSPDYRKQMIIRLLLFYLLVLLIATLLFFSVFSMNVFINGGNLNNSISVFFNYEMRGFFVATLIGFALGALVFFYTQWTDALNREQKLKEEKLIFQYETLRNQVNPHFLFNSLNTLSSFIRQDPELSEVFVSKLSRVYRYILENREKEFVPLLTELEFVRNYFALQQIRDEEKIDLKIEINRIQDSEIMPVSVQLLVENALKHNAATRKQPLEIIIHDEGLDKLVVRNNLQKKSILEDSPKTGLKNLNERCRLIMKCEIEVMKTKTEFVVKIPVKIK